MSLCKCLMLSKFFLPGKTIRSSSSEGRSRVPCLPRAAPTDRPWPTWCLRFTAFQLWHYNSRHRISHATQSRERTIRRPQRRRLPYFWLWQKSPEFLSYITMSETDIPSTLSVRGAGCGCNNQCLDRGMILIKRKSNLYVRDRDSFGPLRLFVLVYTEPCFIK